MKIGTFHTPPRNQGQIVEVSYAMIDGQVIRRTCDQSDRSTEYAITKAKIDDEGDYWNGEPTNARWRKISASELARMFSQDYEVEF